MGAIPLAPGCTVKSLDLSGTPAEKITPTGAARLQAESDREASEAADWAEQQPDPIAEDALTNVFA